MPARGEPLSPRTSWSLFPFLLQNPLRTDGLFAMQNILAAIIARAHRWQEVNLNFNGGTYESFSGRVEILDMGNICTTSYNPHRPVSLTTPSFNQLDDRAAI
ncbi:hypothetical protein K443DRAFT_8870 [Laccaria amethystina LaAM-08-1]|uniref:Uncharacterized protein n=1 Tax=Laccaria amethystina LaAM-08-1 TaxID=1095629 RepID=A0A0C9XBI0_9AGAR|nr:hypothetical protein K443DRAFT_8870 [Laccaria amethystina LaAM-08-1]